MLTREEVLKIAKLARLELSEAEVETYRGRLGRVLEYMRELSALETPPDANVAFVRHVPKDSVAFREDKAIPFQAIKQLLENAPALEGTSFSLPTVVEHE